MNDAATPPPELPGLRLLERIAHTNLSEVWRGTQSPDGAPVAVKIASAESVSDMLEQEALAVKALRDSRVVGVVPVELRTAPVPHLVLPWIGRRTLRDALALIRTGDDRSRVLDTFFRVVQIASRVQRAGYLHGDLKPENVILDESGNPWLTDFGMARTIRSARLDSRISLSMSRSEGEWGGTLHYLPPEGLQGDAPAPSWDVYALGVMLHEILLGRRPDRAATPDSLKTVLPAEVVQVLLDALAYAPQDRISTAGALLERLEGIRGELTARGPARWLLRSGRVFLAGLAAFFVALRYGFVAALLAFYIGVLCFAFSAPYVLLLYLPFLLLHTTVRWEGPETVEEAQLRQSGAVPGWKSRG